MREVKEEKKTFWGRVKSWFVNIWNRFTSLFSSNKSKATVAAESSNVIPTPTEGKDMGAVQQQVPATPNMETSPQQPEGETPKSVNPPATPEMPEEAKKGESEKVGNNGDPKPAQTIMDSSAKGGQQDKTKVPAKSIGKIYENGGSKLVLSLEDKEYSILQACKNPTKSEEFDALIKCDKGNFLITGLYTSMQKINGNMVIIDSIAKQDGSDSSVKLSGMKDMLGMNPLTTEVKITEISKAPLKVKEPEVKSPAAGDGNNGSPNPETDAEGNPQKKTPPVVPKKPKLGFIKVDGSYLKLVVRKDCKSFDKSNVAQNGGYRAYVTIGRKAFCVIVDPFPTIVGQNQSFLVKSMKPQDVDESQVICNFYQIKAKLGLDGATTDVEITRISDKPFPEVESPDQANSAKPDGETPTAFLETVDLKVQQVADNGQSVPKAGNSK